MTWGRLAALGVCLGGCATLPEPSPGGDASAGVTDAGTCQPGESCGDGAICAGGQCCEVVHACGDSCCSQTQVCSFQTCVTPGNPCTESADCKPDEYCEYGAGLGSDAGTPMPGCTGGKPLLTGRCLPRPPVCGATDMGGPCLDKCEVVPQTIAFDPVVKYSWGGQTVPPYSTDVMMAPIVIQLDDDNCDGKITSDDIPDIAFVTFSGGAYSGLGTLHVISIIGGQVVEKWKLPGAVHGASGLAAGDLDGDGSPEIVGCAPPSTDASNTGVVAFRANGSPFWTQSDTTLVHCGYEAPALGDPEHTGQPLVLVGLTLLDGKTGAIVKALDPATGAGARLTGFSDLDGDGKLDVVGEGNRAFRTNGTKIWDRSSGPNAIPSGYQAVGDLDRDGKPEVVMISSGAPHQVYVLAYDPASPGGAKVVRAAVDINAGMSTATFCGATYEYGGGPPTIADFDGDGFPDVGAAGAVGYVVLSGKKLMNPAIPNDQTVLWFKPTQDCSSAVTGSAVFDFNGDGKAEVVYADEVHLWIYDGTSGTQLIPDTCNTSGTLWEYPVVADVDNDGQADIVLASNAYALTCNGTKQSGIRILSSKSGSWVRTRRVWNQHTYHVTNIDENGRIPINEPNNWITPGLDNYRQNKQPGGEFAAPDAVVTIGPKCSGQYGLVATVRNLGQAVLPPGQLVVFYAGVPGTPIGQLSTTQPLYPAQAESLVLPLPNPPPGVSDGSVPIHGAVMVQPPATECRTDNNHAPQASGQCGQVL